MAETASLDSLLERALASSGATTPQDVLVIALHSNLLSADYVCIAIGDENFGADSGRSTKAISSPSSPQLPVGWNTHSQDVYALQYRHEKTQQLCLVKAIPMGEQLLISAIAACKSDEVFSVSLDIAKFVKSDSSFDSKSVFMDLLQLISKLSRELEAKLSQVCEHVKTPVFVGAGIGEHAVPGRRPPNADPLRVGPPNPDPLAGPPNPDPLRVGPPRYPNMPIGDPDPLAEPGPFGYGDRDRLPLGGGGGMIYDPMRQGGRMGGGGLPGFGPHGPFPPSHPPGARFDPVTPLGPQPRPRPPGRNPRGGGVGFYGPDPDHLPPPGYDDMFS